MQPIKLNFHFLCSIFFFAFSPYSNGQDQITGFVQDELGEPLSYSNVLLISLPDSMFVAGTITDTLGAFQFRKPAIGNYLLQFKLLGFEESAIPLIINSENPTTIELAPIALSPTDYILSSVEVKAEKPLIIQAIDRTIINLEQQITTAGTSVLELLENLPGVVVDRQNERIMILGKSGVRLLIDNKQQYLTDDALFNYLSSFSSDNISTIELITSPPANFDADGNAGYINLKLKKLQEDGINGNYSMAGGYGNGRVINGSTNIHIRKAPFSLAINYVLANHSQDQFSSLYRKIGLEESQLETRSQINRFPDVTSHNAQLVFDYQLNEQSLLSTTWIGATRNWNMDAESSIQLFPANGPDTLIQSTVREENDWSSIQGNIHFKHVFTPKQTLSADFDLLWFYNTNPNDYRFDYQIIDGPSLFGIDWTSRKVTPFRISVGKMDYQAAFRTNLTFSAGLKASRATFENDVQVRQNGVLITAFSSLSNLKETVSAAYAQLEYQATPELTIKAGLRYEYSDSKLAESDGTILVDRSFGMLFPSFYVQYKALNFSYSKRINRPSFRDMAPFLIFIDPYTSLSGNPALQPSIDHSVSINYQYKGFNIQLQYTREDSSIAFFQNRFNQETNTQSILPTNLKRSDFFTFSLNKAFKIKPWWTGLINGDYYYTSAMTSDELGELNLAQHSYRLNGSQTFSIPKNWKFEIAAFYRSEILNGNVRIAPQWGLRLGLQKEFASGSELTFQISDLFDSFVYEGTTQIPSEHIFVSRISDFSNRTFRVSFRQSFGNGKVKKLNMNKQLSERKRMN